MFQRPTGCKRLAPSSVAIRVWPQRQCHWQQYNSVQTVLSAGCNGITRFRDGISRAHALTHANTHKHMCTHTHTHTHAHTHTRTDKRACIAISYLSSVRILYWLFWEFNNLGTLRASLPVDYTGPISLIPGFIWSISEYMTARKPCRIPSDNLQTNRKHVLQDLLHDDLKARTGLMKDCMRTWFEKDDGLETRKFCRVHLDGFEPAHYFLKHAHVRERGHFTSGGGAGSRRRWREVVRQREERTRLHGHWPLYGAQQEQLTPRFLQKNHLKKAQFSWKILQDPNT